MDEEKQLKKSFFFVCEKISCEAGNDGAFAGGVAGALDIRGVLKQGEHAALAVFGEGVQVEGLVVEGGEIDFEVAGVDDDADGRVDGEGYAVDQRVSDADGLDGEGAEGEFFLRRDLDERDFVEELVLFELAFDVGQRELGGVDGNLELAEDPGQSADVVFVAMGEDDGADVLPVLGEVGDVGHDDVDAEQLRFREHEAGVDDDDVVFPANCEAVHAEFAEAAEGDDFQFICLHLSGSMLTPARVHGCESVGSEVVQKYAGILSSARVRRSSLIHTPVLADTIEFENRRRDRKRVLTGRHSGDTLALTHGIRKLAARKRRQFRLVIEEINLRRRAGLMEINDPLRLWAQSAAGPARPPNSAALFGGGASPANNFGLSSEASAATPMP